MIKVILAIVTVLAVVAVGGLLKLTFRPVRTLRGLFRPAPAPARLTAV